MTASTPVANEQATDLDSGPDAPQESRAIGAYNASFDGLRWIAMSVMLAFHAGFSWGQGAAFSLSQFFTLSGFLITSLLLRNRNAEGRPDLRVFWTRRFRRLMPAAVLTLAAIVVFAIPFADASQLAKLPSQVISALFYVVNWQFVLSDQSYVAQFASPSPVVHFWSLSVEEQFYIVMPLVLMVVLRFTTSMRALTIFFGVAAVLSAAWMVTLYHLGASIDRLYYGTDTRAAEFLVGAALACFMLHRPIRVTPKLRSRLSLASLVVLGITIVLWTSIPLTNLALYRGGFFVFSLLTAVLITALFLGVGPLATIFAWGPLPALGRITYGVYLVQWPIFLWLDEERTGLSRWPLLVLQLALILGIATAMYHLIELPIRGRRMLTGVAGWVVAPASAAAICIGVVVVGSSGPGDPLAPLAKVSSAAPPTVNEDDALNVLVISDERGGDLAEAIQVRADEDGSRVNVTMGPGFGCAPSPAPTTGCEEWRTTWTDAVRESNPDVVVLAVTQWAPDQIAAVSGAESAGSTEGQRAWADAALAEGMDILTADGATVVWAPYLTTSLPDHLAWSEQPFGYSMLRMPGQRADVRLLPFTSPGPLLARISDDSFHRANADVVLEQSTPLERNSDSGATKILVVGDSISASLGVGLERWAEEVGDATVWTTALLGCGFVPEGEIDFAGQKRFPSHCFGVQDGWREQVEEFDPDVVVVSTTVWDLIPHKLPEWDKFREPGDPIFDEFLVSRYQEAIDIFTSQGARVVWLEGPCFRGAFQPVVDRLNDTLLVRLREQNPDVLEIYPFERLACPDGQMVTTLGGVADPRPDDIHYSPDAAYWLAQQFGPALIS